MPIQWILWPDLRLRRQYSLGTRQNVRFFHAAAQIISAQLFKTNDVVSKRIVEALNIKYRIYANIFAEKMWVAFAFAKATYSFSAKIPVN